MALPNLTSQPVSQSYKGLLHTSNTELTGETDPQVVYDGMGNKTSMKLGGEKKGVKFTGSVTADDFKIVVGSSEKNLIDYIYPVGSVYLSVEPTISPSFLFPNTAWERISEGRFIVGVGSSADINGASKTFLFGDNDGEYEHALTIDEMPTHRHGFTGANGNTNQQTRSPFELTNDDPEQTWEPGSEANTGDIGILDTGGNQAHNNTPPSFGLYIWKRIS